MKKLKIVLLFLKLLLFFFIYEIISNQLYPIISRSILYGRYGREFIVEMSCILLAVIVIIIFKNTYIFKEKKENFSKSLLIGGFMIGLSFLSLLVNLLSLKTNPLIIDVLSLLLYCLSIGVMEEILCRGWIQNEFIEKYSNTQKQVIISILCSSIIFGGMHISNIWIGGQGIIETIAQIIQAIGAGFLLGCIYYRTKNIWANAFIHGFWDFAIYISLIDTIKDCTEGNITKTYLISSLLISIIMSIIYILIGLYLLRKDKIKDLVSIKYTAEEIEKSEKNKSRLIFIIIVLYFSIGYLPEYDNPEICYNYDLKEISYNELTYPVYTEYQLDNSNNQYKLKLEDNIFSITNLKTNEKQEFYNKTILNFIVIQNNDIYTILLIGYNEYQTDTITYITNINEKELDTEEFISYIIKSFNIIENSPTVEKTGYIIDNQNNIKYIFLETYKKDKLILIDNNLYLFN